MKYSLINLLIILLLSNQLLAQSMGLNHRKYWWYKSRLNNDFVKVGLGDGESLPFNQRGLGATNFSGFQSDMKIGDGTSTLGLYIAQLATEYALLKKNQQNTEKVKHELFCALNAFDRLDYKAENLDEYGVYRLNGYFIRDDTPKNFVRNNYDHFNYFSNWDGNTLANFGGNWLPDTYLNDGGFHSKIEQGMSNVTSCWSQHIEDGFPDVLIRESQDQAYDMLLGLAFVNKFVGAGITDNNSQFPYTGIIEIRAQARNQAQRIIDFIREPKDKNGNDCNASTWDKLVNSWIINNPTTCNEIPHSSSNDEGGDARLFAYALGESECQITSNSFSAPNIANLLAIPQACPGSGYHNVYSSTTGFAVWNQLATTPIYNPSDPSIGMDNRVFVSNLASICNCIQGSVPDQMVQQFITNLQQTPVFGWLGTILGWIWKWITFSIHVLIPGYYSNITQSAITTNAYKLNSPLDHAPLAHALLHGYQTYAPNPQYSFDYLLDVAPCDGIYNFNGNQWGHFQWSSDNRCEHPNRIGQHTEFPGEYNAIDYMLYHNLYYLHKAGLFGGNSSMVDLSDVYVNLPASLSCHNINAYETITSENTVLTCNSETVWRAGKIIYFGAGTSITGNGSSTTGPNFHAYIQKFDCATDIGAYRMANTDSISNESIDNSEDGYSQGIRYHTVVYPEDELSISEVKNDNRNQDDNLITELPVEEDPIENLMKASYSNYSKELFIKPTVTSDRVRAYFTMEDDEIAFINVMDLSGKIIYSNDQVKKDDTGLGIDLSNYASGTYILKFTTTKGTNKTQKIIKE